MLMAREPSRRRCRARRGPSRLRLLARRARRRAAHSHLRATKFGLRGFALGLREDLRASGVGVSVVIPGFIREAGMFADSGGQAAAGARDRDPRAGRSRRRQGDRARQGRGRRRPAAPAGAGHFALAAPDRRRVARPRGGGQRRRSPTRSADRPGGQAVAEDATLEVGMSTTASAPRATLEVSGREYEIHRLDALQERYDVARLPYSLKVLLENVLRLEDGESVTARRRRDDRHLGRDGRAERRDPLPAGPRADAGLHRRARGRRPGGDARRDGRARRATREDQPAGPGRPGHRPLGAGRRLRQRPRVRHQRRARVRAQRGALRVPALGPAGLRQLPRRAAGDRASATRSTSSTSARSSSRASATASRQAYPDTLVGTDSHTTMINGLGVLGWGVGGIEAEAAMLGQPISMLLPQVVGFRLDGELAEGATATDLVLTGHRDAPRARRGRQVRRVLRPRPAHARARRPGDDRQHVAGVRLDLRDLPGRPRDAALPRVHRPADRADRARRRLHARAGHVPRPRTPRSRPSRRPLELDLGDGRAGDRRAEAPPGPDRADRRQGGLPRVAAGVRPRGRRERSATRYDEAVAETFPASDPPGRGPRRRARASRGRAGEAAAVDEARTSRPGRGRRSRTAPRSSSTTAAS